MARARLLPDAQPLPPADRNAEGGPLTRDATTERALRAGVQRRSPTGRAPLPRPLRLEADRVRAARDLGQPLHRPKSGRGPARARAGRVGVEQLRRPPPSPRAELAGCACSATAAGPRSRTSG